MEVPKKPDKNKKKPEEDKQTFTYLSSAHRSSQEICQLVKPVTLVQYHFSCLLIIDILLTELSLHERILTLVVCRDLTQQRRSRFSHTCMD